MQPVDQSSGLRKLTSIVGAQVPASPMFLAALEVALQLAADTDGAFDPTIGGALERAGFSGNFRTDFDTGSRAAEAGATYRDVHLNLPDHTVTVDRPLMLDLGAVAKGRVIDLAARELASTRTGSESNTLAIRTASSRCSRSKRARVKLPSFRACDRAVPASAHGLVASALYSPLAAR